MKIDIRENKKVKCELYHDLIQNNHDKLKHYPDMETVTKEWLKALDKVKG